MYRDVEPKRGKAFAIGAGGCVGIFLLLAIIAVSAGGYAYIDAGGFIFLVIIGGLIGLGINAIYKKGEKKSALSTHRPTNADTQIARAEAELRDGIITKEEFDARVKRINFWREESP